MGVLNKSDGQTLSPLFSKQEINTLCQIDSCYNSGKYNAVIQLSDQIIDSGYASKYDYELYVRLFYSAYTKDKNNAYRYIRTALVRGLNNIEGYNVWDFLIFDSIRNNIIKEAFNQNSGHKNDMDLIAQIANHFTQDSLLRSVNIPYLDSLKNKDTVRYNQHYLALRHSDSINSIFVEKVLFQYKTWPGYALVGKDGDRKFWLLLQHSDENVPLQILGLKMMETSVITHNTNRRNYAYLYDRICVNTGRKQLFGTQFSKHEFDSLSGKHEMILHPLEDPLNLNCYRHCMKLENIDTYKESAENHFFNKEKQSLKN